MACAAALAWTTGTLTGDFAAGEVAGAVLLTGGGNAVGTALADWFWIAQALKSKAVVAELATATNAVWRKARTAEEDLRFNAKGPRPEVHNPDRGH
jgi:hypothetical protein